MAKTSIALQLYSVYEDCEKNFWKTLESVAKIGYKGVEFAGYYNKTAGELRKNLNNLGLKVAGTHISLDSLLDDELEKTIEFNKILGNRNFIVPWLPEEKMNSKTAALSTANLFNEIAEKIKPDGMRIGYHNHDWEFKCIDGESLWDIFFGTTFSQVIMQLDTGNAMQGGVKDSEVSEIVKRFPGRAITVHLKEFSSTMKDAVIGEGEVKWKEFFSVCEASGGTEWYIVEQESYACEPLECVRKCLDNLKKMGINF